MSELKALATFDLTGELKIPMFAECDTLQSSVHEALCRGIHERDLVALTWLTTYVTDIAVEQVIAV